MFNKPPLSERRGIPFYLHKTEMDFRNDPYERFRESVMRQLALHYGDQYWGNYPFQGIINWLAEQMPDDEDLAFLDVGCSVGRLLREVAHLRPSWRLVGVDYAYNALRTCHQLLQLGESVSLDYREKGLPLFTITGQQIPQLQLGLTTAEVLPIADDSVDVISSSFLMDRLQHPTIAVQEWYRVLAPGGRLYLVSPFNWQSAHLWEIFPNPARAQRLLFDPQYWHLIHQDRFNLQEPIDANGNFVNWKVYLWCFEKN